MHYIQKRTVAPASYPVTLAECKADLRIQYTAEDALINSYIADATDYMDLPSGVIGKALITQEWQVSIPFADSLGRVFLPINPVQAIDSIEYYDTDNVLQPLVVSDFFLYSDEDSALIEPKPGTSWPSTYDRRDAIVITLTAGYGDASTDVPNSIRRAIRLLVAHWYEHRTAATSGAMVELPLAVQNLVSINRKGWVA